MAGLLDKISSNLSRDADPNKPTKEELRASEEQARRARLDALEEQARARFPNALPKGHPDRKQGDALFPMHRGHAMAAGHMGLGG